MLTATSPACAALINSPPRSAPDHPSLSPPLPPTTLRRTAHHDIACAHPPPVAAPWTLLSHPSPLVCPLALALRSLARFAQSPPLLPRTPFDSVPNYALHAAAPSACRCSPRLHDKQSLHRDSIKTASDCASLCLQSSHQCLKYTPRVLCCHPQPGTPNRVSRILGTSLART